MRFFILLITLTGFLGCQSHQKPTLRTLSSTGISSQNFQYLFDLAQIPTPEALGPWTDKLEDNFEFYYNQKTELKCSNNLLSPLTPEQIKKKYHLHRSAAFDVRRIKKTDDSCLVGTPYNSKSTACLSPTQINIVVVSDLYQDKCGNTYRGFWLVSFLSKNETVHTLVAKGKSLIRKPDSDFYNEMIAGPTSEIKTSDFLFLTQE